MSRLQNIGEGNRDDAFYYKMPKLVTKIEGRGNRIKTNVVNMVDVAKVLARPPAYTTEFFGTELGAQSKYDEKTGTSIVNGAHETTKLVKLLGIFIKKYVQCYNCGNPETAVNVSNSQLITLQCAACGFASDVDMDDQLTTFILKNPPEENKRGKDKSFRRVEKARLDEGELVPERKKLGKDKSLRRAEKEWLEEGKLVEKVIKKELKEKKKTEDQGKVPKEKFSGSDEEVSGRAGRGDEEDVDDVCDSDDNDVQRQMDPSVDAGWKKRIQEQLMREASERIRSSVSEKYYDAWEDEWPFLGPVQRDVNRHPKAGDIIHSGAELIRFLEMFFSLKIINCVNARLEAAKHSTLGENYVRRGVYGSFVQNLSYDIMTNIEENIITCNGEESSENNPNPWIEVSSKRRRDDGGGHDTSSTGRGDRGESSGRGNQGGNRGDEGGNSGDGGNNGGDRGAGGGRGRGRGRRGGAMAQTNQRPNVNKFCGVQRELIKMRPWISPEKKFNATQVERNRRTSTIANRSLEFQKDSMVKQFSELFYDPFSDTDGFVHLFHGTRTPSLQKFERVGIRPGLRKNEFSSNRAFYVTNSITTAFEHPLHFHTSLTGDLAGTVSILVFKVPTSELHGIERVGQYEKPFTVQWFQDADHEWHEFVKLNWTEEAAEDNTDIIIGPMSIPPPQPSVEKFKALMIKRKYPQQVAFATMRARAWLEDHLVAILTEDRPNF